MTPARVWGTLVAVLVLAALALTAARIVEYVSLRSPTGTTFALASADTAFAVRDSLGVRIVESHSPQWRNGQAWTLAPDPLLDLAESGAGEAHEFHRVADMLRTDDGDLVINNGGTQQVRVYDATGRSLRSFGGAGDGPGEFWSPGVVSYRGGRLVTVFSYRRATLLHLDSGLVRVESPAAQPFRSPVANTFTWGIGVPHLDNPPILSQLHRPLLPVVRWNDGGVVDTIATVQGSESFVELSGDDVIDARPIMGKTMHLSPTPEGDLVVGTGEMLEHKRLAQGGSEVVLVARVLGVDLTASKREVARERELRLGPNPSALVRSIVERLPDPATKPAYQRMLVDGAGNVWAGEFLGLLRRDASQKWYVWDADGVWLGIVEMPPRFELFRVGVDEVLGVWRDGNDVEHPQVLRLNKPFFD